MVEDFVSTRGRLPAGKDKCKGATKAFSEHGMSGCGSQRRHVQKIALSKMKNRLINKPH